MKHRISPTVDCVYKAILGAEENMNLLIDFVNGVLSPQFPISDVEILNPYNEREFYSDKLTIVDVKVKDEKGTTYQVEIQLAIFLICRRGCSTRGVISISPSYKAESHSQH